MLAILGIACGSPDPVDARWDAAALPAARAARATPGFTEEVERAARPDASAEALDRVARTLRDAPGSWSGGCSSPESRPSSLALLSAGQGLAAHGRADDAAALAVRLWREGDGMQPLIGLELARQAADAGAAVEAPTLSGVRDVVVREIACADAKFDTLDPAEVPWAIDLRAERTAFRRWSLRILDAWEPRWRDARAARAVVRQADAHLPEGPVASVLASGVRAGAVELLDRVEAWR